LTPGGLIRQQRLIAAKELLRRTDLSLQEIALKCGFSTAFSFSRSFRKQYGIPPSVYRSENR
jgi:AraC family transcriptional regulator